MCRASSSARGIMSLGLGAIVNCHGETSFWKVIMGILKYINTSKLKIGYA
jgi:hypothetical protein